VVQAIFNQTYTGFLGGNAEYGQNLSALSKGSFANGNASGGDIVAVGQGSFVQGSAEYGSITAVGYGSFAQGYSNSLLGILSAGQGSFAQGSSYGGLIGAYNNGAFCARIRRWSVWHVSRGNRFICAG